MPGTILLTAIGGLLFGALIGGAAAVVAASSGAVALFILARSAFGALLTGRAASVAARLREGMAGNAVFYLMFVRLAPVFPFWAVNLACAIVGVPLRLFAATTLVGIMPATFAFATAGAGLDSVIMAEKAAFEACAAAGGWDCRFDVGLRSLATPQLVGGLAVLACLSLLPVALKRAGVLRRSGATARD
nr:VTT domain-containing protein [Alsobacter ponti]